MSSLRPAQTIVILLTCAAAGAAEARAPEPDGPVPDGLSRAAKVGRTVVVPVRVGTIPDSSAPLLGAFEEGLRENPRWRVEAGAGLASLRNASESGPTPATVADWDRLASQVDASVELLAKAAPGEAAAALDPLRSELQRAFRAGPFSERGASLLYRTGGLLAAALAGAGEAERARTIAGETALVFPGRKPAEVDRLPKEAMDLLAAPAPAATATLRVLTSPEACAVTVNGVPAGRAPLELGVMSGEVYFAQAKCGERKTRPRRLFPTSEATARREVLDADFEQSLDWTSGLTLRFESSAQRKHLEETYARRVAETLDADTVVLVSAGQLGGADVINARAYLRSGYLVRQALARLEAPRVRALGAYLATGKAAPGVLLAEEAASLALGGAPTAPPAPQQPWYKDWLGWTLTGAGAATLVTGLVLQSKATDRNSEADQAARTDPLREQDLRNESGSLEFSSFVSFALGATLALSGLLLLAIPDESSPRGEMIGVAPTKGGAFVNWSARF